jgi:hypothetical protein
MEDRAHITLPKQGDQVVRIPSSVCVALSDMYASLGKRQVT